MSSKQVKQIDADVLSTTSSSTTAPETSSKHSGNILKKLFHKEMSDDEPSKAKRKSISSSGPYIMTTDPETGRELLQKNPHWPNEDSWKEVEASKGTWAMGGEMGDPKKDFGATTG